MRAGVLRDEPGREAARDRRMARPPVVHRGAVSPGVEEQAICAASAVPGFCAGGGGDEQVGVRASFAGSFNYILGCWLTNNIVTIHTI